MRGKPASPRNGGRHAKVRPASSRTPQALLIHQLVREVRLGEITLDAAHARLKAIRRLQRFELDQAA